MHLGDPTGEREAEADPAARVSASVRLARGLATVEGCEDALALGRRDAGARVSHRQHDAVVIARGRERDGRRAVLDGVLQEVPERAPQQRFVGDELDWRPVLDPDRDVCGEWMAACAPGEVGQERAGVDGAEMRGEAGRVQPRGGEDVLDQAIQFAEISLDGAQMPIAFGGKDLLRGAADRGVSTRLNREEIRGGIDLRLIDDLCHHHGNHLRHADRPGLHHVPGLRLPGVCARLADSRGGASPPFEDPPEIDRRMDASA
jgi:hypothetical protein